jgi:plastocyanin
MSKIVLALISVLIIGGASAVYFAVQKNPSGNVIVFDGNTFSPAQLTIAHGDTVVFSNKSDEPFWPASNLHPSHLVYGEFDPKKPVEAGGSWSFTFTKDGEWGYHDHIKSTIKGTITVLAKDGEAVAVDCENGQNSQKCWETSILQALEEGGVDKAFDVFTALYDSNQEFAKSCHSFVHLIGERSYDQFVNHEEFKLSPKTQFCGYGFFHGFMETLLIQSGDIELSREFCKHVDATLSEDTPSAWKACYHGIGHRRNGI